MFKKGGIREAAKILSSFSIEERVRIFEIMIKKDPETAEIIRQNLVLFEDLLYATPKMLQELFVVVDFKDIALSLKLSSNELRDHILSNISKNNKLEIMDILEGPKVKKRDVIEAMSRVMTVVREKVERGELILSPTSSEEYV